MKHVKKSKRVPGFRALARKAEKLIEEIRAGKSRAELTASLLEVERALQDLI